MCRYSVVIPAILAALILPVTAVEAAGAMTTPKPEAPAPAPAAAPAATPEPSVPDVMLPAPRVTGLISVEATLAARGKVQNLQKNQLTLDQLGQLEFAVFGMPSTAAGISASSQMLDPIGMYLVLDTGVYVCKPRERSLGRVTKGDKRVFLAGVVSAIRAVSEAPCSVVITGKGIQAGGQVSSTREMTLVAAGKAAAAVEMQSLAIGLGAVMCERIGAPQVTEVLGLPADEMPICVLAVGYPLSGPLVEPSVSDKGGAAAAKVPSVLLVVPQRAIVDHEYEVVTSALKSSNIQVTVASAETGTYRTTAGKEVQATAKLGEVDAASYNAIVFLGGPEVRQYYQDPAARKLVLDAVRAKKIVGALSTAPRILVNAGVMTGLSVAANVTERQGIAREGAIASSADCERVESDGATMITATGSRSAVQKFAQQLIDAVTSPPTTSEAAASPAAQ